MRYINAIYCQHCQEKIMMVAGRWRHVNQHSPVNSYECSGNGGDQHQPR